MGKNVFYEDSFERIWKEYGARGSKAKAYAAWKKTANVRPKDDLMLCCIAAYLEDLTAFNKGRKPDQHRDKLHLSTFLGERDMRWETFLERAEELLKTDRGHREAKDAAVSASAASWPSPVLTKLGLSPAIIEKWFFPCVLEMGSPPEILAPSNFHCRWLQDKFSAHIERALGPDVLITSP